MDGKPNILIRHQTTPRQVAAAKINIKMILGEYPNKVFLKRIRKEEDDWCDYCYMNHNLLYTDDIKHMITNCTIFADNAQLQTKREEIVKLACNHIGITAADNIHKSADLMTAFILNPSSVQHQLSAYLEEKEVTAIIFQTQSFLLELHNVRKRGKSRKNRRNTNQECPVNPGSLPSNTRGNLTQDIRSFCVNRNQLTISQPHSFQFNNISQSSMSRLMMRDMQHSDFFLTILGTKACIIAAQLLTPFGRRNLWKNGVVRITSMQGVTKLIMITSDSEEALMHLSMATSSNLPMSEAIKILNISPVKCVNLDDMHPDAPANIDAPVTVICCSFSV